MARDRKNPPLLGQLIQEGVLDDIVEQILNTVPPGSDIYTTNILYDTVVAKAPPLLPSTFNALLSRAAQEIEARWAAQEPQDFAQSKIDRIPIVPERTGKQIDYTQRILYRIDITYPTVGGDTTTRTVYVPAQAPLTYDQLKAEAIDGLQALLDLHGERYEEPDGDLADIAVFSIDDVSRSF